MERTRRNGSTHAVYSLCHVQRDNAILNNIRMLYTNFTCSVHTPEFIMTPEQEKEVSRSFTLLLYNI